MREAKPLAILLGLLWSSCAFAERSAEIVFMRQDFSPAKILKDWEVLTSAVSKLTGKTTYTLVNKDSKVISDAVENFSGDALLDTWFPVLRHDPHSFLEPALIVWRNGQETYESCIIAAKDSVFTNSKALNKAKIAFEDPFSTSGFALPMAALIETVPTSFSFQLIKGPSEATILETIKTTEITANKMGYVFTKSEETSLRWLESKAIDLAAIRCDAVNNDKHRIVLKTPKIPRSLVAFHKKFAPELRNKIEDFLVSLEPGSPILAAMGKATKVSRISDEQKKVMEKMKPLLKKVMELPIP